MRKSKRRARCKAKRKLFVKRMRTFLNDAVPELMVMETGVKDVKESFEAFKTWSSDLKARGLVITPDGAKIVET